MLRASFGAPVFFGAAYIGGMKRLERLKRLLLDSGAVRFGEFTLASGKTSDAYVDGRLVTLNGEGAALIAELLWERMKPLEPDCVGGMVIGADPIIGALIAHAFRDGTLLRGFLVRKEPKAYGTKRTVEGPKPEGSSKPARAIILDDTMTTGGSTVKAARHVRDEWGVEVVAAFAVVDRGEGAAEAFAEQGIEFHCLLTLDELRAG